MAQSAQTSQNRRDQPAHQSPVAIGKGFQSGMGRGAIELFVERATLVQDAIENVGRDSSRREAGHFSWQSESLRRHGGGHIL